MAKRGSESFSASDKAKVRVIFAEVEGNNESVQEALKTMVSAMSRPVRVASEQRDGKPTALLGQSSIEEVEETINGTGEAEPLEQEPIPATNRKPRGTGKRDRNVGLSLVPDLNFRPNGHATLKDFVEQKSPKHDVETTLAILHYMQHLMKLPKIGPAHVMTAFKELGRAVPLDLKQTIRNAKSTKMWLNFSDIEEIRTTTQGDNFVEYEMGKGVSS